MSVPPTLRRESEVQSARLRAGSGDLAALVGEPPEGVRRRRPVVLVPGYTGSKEDFLPVLAPLARVGHRAIALDLRGQHESTGPDDPTAYTIDALAKDVADVLASLPEPAHLVGHSFGGLITRRAILAGCRPASLTLVGSGPAALGGQRAAITELMRPVLAEGGVAAIADAAAAMDRDNPRMAGVGPDVVEFLHRRWLAANPTGVLVMGEELLGASDETDALAATGLPTFVLYGENDDAWPPAEQHAMAGRLGAREVCIPGAAHSPACESPEAFVDAVLAFWAGVDATAE